ncbi:shikimate dehydrogenase family protein [Gynuella sp.]|uniref:shikimate dehydrogenase family protein n=1 Tax=Gynuella sp. TaxID=2969146 RepID=UPI003D0E8F65
MIQLGLIGKGIQRTQVHQLHQALGELCGITVNYQLLDADQEPHLSLEQRVQRAISEGYRGVNVTHPFKAEVSAMVKQHGAVPETLGSYNTLIFTDGNIRGENTDYSGFKAGFQRTFDTLKPGAVLLLGSGGVGRSIAFALGELSARQIFLYDTRPEAAHVLAGVLQAAGYPCVTVTEDTLTEVAAQVDGIVNATPIGMYQYPGIPLAKTAIQAPRWGFDAIYTPMNTEFMIAMDACGAQTMSGYELFLNQGVDAFEHFTGISLNRDAAIQFYLQKRSMSC